MTIDAVIFDLDGTLLDTLGDIAAGANRVLVESGFPPHPDAAYKQFIGSGVRVLFHRALPPGADTDDQIERCVLRFRHAYGEGWNIRTRPYDGIPELLDELSRREIALAVLSNKPDDFTRRCVAFYFAGRPFRVVAGERPGRPRKPDPAGALAIAHDLAITPDRFLYLGDSSVDMQTGHRAGMHPIGVSWGFRSVEELREHGAEAIVDHPSELLRLIAPR
jgi:phosphoglycolate phosphatase